MIYVKANVERITNSEVEARKLEAAGFKRIDKKPVATEVKPAAVAEEDSTTQTVSQRRRRRIQKAAE